MIETKMNSKYKDTMFRLLFREKKELLSLYNATNGTSYENEDELEVNTLENAIYMNMKNDISFVFDLELNLYEHQSSTNPNMPLRDLFYVSRVLQNLTKEDNLYGKMKVKIPTPRFIVFYNGMEEMPERMEYRLSDLFEKPVKEPELELRITVLNINPGKNEPVLENCRTLKEYMIYVDKVRRYLKRMPIEEAVERVIDECIQERILVDFLRKHRAEAKAVSIFEYDQEKHMKFIREEGWEEGWEEGRQQGMHEGCAIGIRAFIEANLEEHISPERITEKLVKHFGLTQEKAREYLQEFYPKS